MKLQASLFVFLLFMTGSGFPLAEEQDFAATEATDKETVVLLHGFARGKFAMWPLSWRLEEAGFEVVRIGYDSLRESPEEILAGVSRQIDACCRELSRPVHFVGHSLGGLVIRAYLAENELEHRGRVVLIGTPNKGTPVVDQYRDAWWMNLAGPTAKSLGTGPKDFPSTLPAPDYAVGVIAGLKEGGILKDAIPGNDDGLVPVESTKLEGMADFIIVNSSHSRMRYSDEVARQTVAFLRRGEFDYEKSASAELESGRNGSGSLSGVPGPR